MEPLLVTVDDALRALSIGRTKFYEEVNNGRLQVVKAGKRALVPRASLERYVDALVAEANQATA